MTDPQDPLDDWVAEALREVHREEEATQAEAFQVLGVEESETLSTIVSPADVVRMLGGTPNEQLAAEHPGRSSRHQDRQRAKKTLRVESPWKRRMYYRTEWRYQAIAPCHSEKDQMRIVAYIEDNLTGKETDIPAQVADTVRRLVEHSRSQPLGYVPAISSGQQYERLAREYRRYKAQREDRGQ